jgi:hypothetical protein
MRAGDGAVLAVEAHERLRMTHRRAREGGLWWVTTLQQAMCKPGIRSRIGDLVAAILRRIRDKHETESLCAGARVTCKVGDRFSVGRRHRVRERDDGVRSLPITAEPPSLRYYSRCRYAAGLSLPLCPVCFLCASVYVPLCAALSCVKLTPMSVPSPAALMSGLPAVKTPLVVLIPAAAADG